jgi:hypothetical protein
MKKVVYTGEHTYESHVKERVKGHDIITIYDDLSVDVVRHPHAEWNEELEKWEVVTSSMKSRVKSIEKFGERASVRFTKFFKSPYTSNEEINISLESVKDLYGKIATSN